MDGKCVMKNILVVIGAVVVMLASGAVAISVLAVIACRGVCS